MRLKFWGSKESEYYDMPKGKRPRETLKQTAERLIQKRMKKDESYGLRIAEKLVGAAEPEEPRTVTELLQEITAFQKALKEAGMSGNEGKGLWQSVLDVIPVIPQILQQLQQQQGQTQQGHQFTHTIEPPRLEQIGQHIEQPHEQPRLPQQEPEVSLAQLSECLDMEPTEALEVLKTTYPSWVKILAMQTYEGIMAQVTPFKSDAAVLPIIQKLESPEGRVWLQEVIALSKKQ